MLKKFFFVLFIFQVGVHSIAQTKINDTIGGVILTSHRNHLKHLPFIRFHTIMYFVNIEDKYVLRFDDTRISKRSNETDLFMDRFISSF
jgi:hypothetical protein